MEKSNLTACVGTVLVTLTHFEHQTHLQYELSIYEVLT